MLDHRAIHNLMQQIDDEWIEKALYSGRKKTPLQRFAVVAAVLLICIVISTSVAAAISLVSPTFRQWLMEQLHDIQPEIRKMILPEGINGFENGFLVKNMDGENTRVYRIEDEQVVLCETRIWKSYVIFNEEKYEFSFKYVLNGKDVYAWDYEGAAISLTEYDEHTGIVWLSMDNVWNSYYIDYYAESKPQPVVDPNAFKNLWSKRYYWDDNGEKTEGYVKLATDVQSSPDGSYLLYRSNRDCLISEDGKYNIESKGRWYIQDTDTREEHELREAPDYLHGSEISFIDDHLILISFNEENNGRPTVYNCILKKEETLVLSSPDLYKYSQMYEVTETEEKYQFWDIYQSKMYELPKSSEAKVQASYVSPNLICIIEDTGAWKVCFTLEDVVLDFKKGLFEEIGEIDCIYDLDDKRFVIMGSEQGKPVGYYIDFTNVLEDME